MNQRDSSAQVWIRGLDRGDDASPDPEGDCDVGKWFWSQSRPERWIWLFCAVFVPFELVAKAISHTVAYGDFNVVREFGARFLNGTPLYKGGHCFNYMPISAMFHAPIAMVPLWLGSLARTSSAMVCLAYTLTTLGKMVQDRARVVPWPGVVVGGLAVLLCGQYVLRDFDDGGLHLIFLAMIVASMDAVRRGHDGWAGLGFGLVIALKMTPGLFIPFFVWKRRWRLAVYSSLAALGWIVLPAVWMGPSSWWDHQSQWNHLAGNVFASRMDRARVINEVRIQNQGLKPAVVRWLVTYPAGHPLKVNDPIDFAVGNLGEKTAGRVATLAMLALLGGVAWWSRRPWVGRDDPNFVVEMAAVVVLTLLLSPVTWLQHLCWLLPATYLLAAQHLAYQRWSRSVAVVLAVYLVVTLVCNRVLIGREASLILFSWHVHTGGMLAILGLIMATRPTALDRRQPIPVDSFQASALPAFQPVLANFEDDAWASKSN